MINKSEEDKKTIIVVLGMHRSGTSAITRSLKVLGVDLGDNLMPQAEANNAKGFWEDLDINTLNIELLHALGHEWHSIQPISLAELTSPTAESFKLRAIIMLRNKIKNTKIFGLKDPRICRLLPFWQSIFDHLKINTKYIIASRNPMSIARSLNKRDGFDFEKSYYLWLDHITHSITSTSDKLRIVVDYDLLIESPAEQLQRISSFLELNFNVESKEFLEYKKDFIEVSLRNTHFNKEDLLLEYSAPKPAIDIYYSLYEIAKDEVSLDNSGLKLLIKNYINFHQNHLPILKYITKTEEKLKYTEEKNSIYEKEIKEKEIKLTDLSSIILNSEQKINNLSFDLSEHKSKLLQTTSTLEEKDRLISKQNSSINEIYNSTSWKLTKPVRFLGQLRTKNPTNILMKSIQVGGGVLPTFKKTISIFRREGFHGIKSRIIIVNNYSKIIKNNNNHVQNHLKKINWLDETRKIDIDNYDIISFDIFDTAIIRLFESPTDIFKYIEETKNVKNFKADRINSECEARKINSHKKDINLDDIYNNLDISNELELDSEITFSSANPVIYDLYNRAIAANKKIYFISDMYLSADHIKKILDNNGYKKLDVLYVSSVDNLPKGDGSRFIALKEKIGDQKILHIGDNAIADYEWPKRLGLDAIKYHAPDEFFRSDFLIAPMYEKIKNQDSLYLSFLLGLYRKWKYGDKSTGWSVWRDIGFLFGGPLIYNFAQYIQENSSDENHLYFLARDGMIIKHIYDEFFKPSDQKTSYLLASRRAMTFPLFSMSKEQCQKSKQLNLYSVTQPSSTAEEIFERLAYPELNKILLDFKKAIGKSTVINKETIKKILKENHSLLQDKAQQELHGLISYLDKEDFINDSATLIDVGWNGTIQDSLVKALELSNIDKKINGIYLGVSPNADNSNGKEGYIFDANKKENFKSLSPYLDFIELLTSAPTEGLLKFTVKQPFVEFANPCKHEQQRFDISKEIQHGIIDYANQLKDFKNSDLPSFVVSDFIKFFDILRYNADLNIISLFDNVKHSRMPSNSYHHSIINFEVSND